MHRDDHPCAKLIGQGFRLSCSDGVIPAHGDHRGVRLADFRKLTAVKRAADVPKMRDFQAA